MNAKIKKDNIPYSSSSAKKSYENFENMKKEYFSLVQIAKSFKNVYPNGHLEYGRQKISRKTVRQLFERFMSTYSNTIEKLGEIEKLELKENIKNLMTYGSRYKDISKRIFNMKGDFIDEDDSSSLESSSEIL